MDSKKEMYELKKFNKELINNLFEKEQLIDEIATWMSEYFDNGIDIDIEDRYLNMLFHRVSTINLGSTPKNNI